MYAGVRSPPSFLFEEAWMLVTMLVLAVLQVPEPRESPEAQLAPSSPPDTTSAPTAPAAATESPTAAPAQAAPTAATTSPAAATPAPLAPTEKLMTFTKQDLEGAIGRGTAAKGKTRGLVLRDTGRGVMNALSNSGQQMGSGF